MMWDSSLLDPNIPALNLDGNVSLGPTQPAASHDLGPAASGQVEDWLQEAKPGPGGDDSFARHERAQSMSAIPPEINIDFAPPERQQNTQHLYDNVTRGSGDWYQSPSLLPLDMRRRTRSPSPARSVGSMGRFRSSSTGSIQRDYILDLADAQRAPTPQPGSRVQKHPATFQCTLCPKTFTRAYNLRSHLRIHTDERPFMCSVCGKAFARQHDRKRHEGLHSGEKKFFCRGVLGHGSHWGCGRKFARADALGRHFYSEAGQVCIRPLVEEEYAERQKAWSGIIAPQPMMSHTGLDSMDNVLPAALLAQYPALCSMNWSNVHGDSGSSDSYQYTNDFTSPPTRTSSFGGSSYGSTGYAGFGYQHGASRQASDTSLHSMWSATSFSSQRGTRLPGGYECSQCGATFDVPSELRHHERNHMPKEQRPHACNRCGERFLYPKDVQRHIGRKHGGLETSPLLSPILKTSAQHHTEGLGLEPFVLNTEQPQLDSGSLNAGRSPILEQQPTVTSSAFPTCEFNSSDWSDRSENSHSVPDMLWEPTKANAGDDPSPVLNGHNGTTDLNQKYTSNRDDHSGPFTIPRIKSAEILDLKKALDAAKRDASLWREERNFYAELLQDQMSPDDLNLSLRFVHRDEITSPVRRARGWLGGIWTLFKSRRKTDEHVRDGSAQRAVVDLAAELERMDIANSVEGRGKSPGSGRGSRSSSPIRARWKEFEGWVAGA